MFALSYGVRRTGVVRILGGKIAAFTREDEGRYLGGEIGVAGSISGFINTTAAIAIPLPTLALRRGPEYTRKHIDRTKVQVGDTLLVQATPGNVSRLNVTYRTLLGFDCATETD